MHTDTDSILNELYEIDPSLREHEVKLRPLISELLLVKSAIVVDPKFRNRLRTLLMDKVAPARRPFFGIFNTGSMYAMAGALLVILVVAVSGFLGNRGGGQIAFRENISQTGDRAFGPLAGGGTSFDSGSQQSAESGAGVGQSGLKSQTVTSAPVVAPSAPVSNAGSGGGSDSAGGYGGSVGAPLIYPGPQSEVVFKYAGDPFNLPDRTVQVLRRVKDNSDFPAIGDVLKRFSIPGVRLDSLGANGIQQITLTGGGYLITINFQDGFLSIGSDRPIAESGACAPDGPCAGGSRPMPSDESVIRAANDFMRGYGIAVDAYGTPFVLDTWRAAYERLAPQDKPNFYFPDTLTVLYPYSLNGRPVYDQWAANPAGLQVQVSTRDLSVSGLWSVRFGDLESSAYEAETDPAKVIARAERGTIWGGPIRILAPAGSDNAPKTITVSLGTPSPTYLAVQMYRDGASDELYVPALTFPIIDSPDPSLYKRVVVPLAKELLDSTMPPVLPMLKAI